MMFALYQSVGRSTEATLLVSLQPLSLSSLAVPASEASEEAGISGRRGEAKRKRDELRAGVGVRVGRRRERERESNCLPASLPSFPAPLLVSRMHAGKDGDASVKRRSTPSGKRGRRIIHFFLSFCRFTVDLHDAEVKLYHNKSALQETWSLLSNSSHDSSSFLLSSCLVIRCLLLLLCCRSRVVTN